MKFALIGALFLVAGCTSQSDVDTNNCEKISEGMSEPKVQAIMGSALFRHEKEIRGRKRLSLGYSEPRNASGPITIAFENSEYDSYVVVHQWCNGAP